jgi:Prenyltransferase and squalene oxidase repeat
MSLPIKGRRATGPASATDVQRSVPLPGILSSETLDFLPKRTPSWKKAISSFSTSMAIHTAILFILSWIYFELPKRNVFETILTMVVGENNPTGGDAVEIDFGEMPVPMVEAGETGLPEIGEVEPEIMALIDDVEPPSPQKMNTDSIRGGDRVSNGKKIEATPKKSGLKRASAAKSQAQPGMAEEAEGQRNAEHFVGRTPKGKAALLKKMGGTDASEAAVARGLVWLTNHQLPDGSWNFNHVSSPRCDCTMPGRMENNPYAATAMAVMAFLGAGKTHETGEYQLEVRYGIDFLLAQGVRVRKGICYYGELSGPATFYTHGLVTIALSEAYAMTSDIRLRPAVAGAVEFLADTQDFGGGWRYFPGQPGDTSVVAWQLMALKSAQFSRVTVPQKVFSGVERFLISTSSMRGSRYAYLPDRSNSPTPSMTAAGLLSRMYLGAKENHGGMRAGVRFLDEQGPDPSDMYYNYYATQVLHHWGGPEWDRWNNVMREHLIRTQIRDGHASGSWDVADRHGFVGGRVYMTTLALLTLEVYYRHLPLYQKDRIDFPLIHPEAQAEK